MTGTITALTLQKRDKERVNVFLDGEYAFSLHLHPARALKRGQRLGEADIACLQSADEAHRAYHNALHFLGYRPRSQAEIERHLHRKDYSAEAIDAAVERLLGNRHVDDAAFARYWLDNRQRFRPRGSRALRYELRQKGIDDDIIGDVLTTLDEEASARDAIARKLDRWRGLDQTDFRKKVTGFLSRRGFGYDTIRAVYQKARESDKL